MKKKSLMVGNNEVDLTQNLMYKHFTPQKKNMEQKEVKNKTEKQQLARGNRGCLPKLFIVKTQERSKDTKTN